MKRNDVPGSTDRDRDYWRDVGTIDSFFDAHHGPDLDAADLQPLQHASGRSTRRPSTRRRRSSCATRSGRIGNAIDSIVSLGSVLSGHAPRAQRGRPVDARRRRVDDHRLGAVRPRPRRRRAPASTARSSTRTSSSPTARRSASTASATSSAASPSPTPASPSSARACTSTPDHAGAGAVARGASVGGMPAPSARFLVVLDADSTLIRNEVIELLADEAGRGAEVAAATEAAMRGEVDFAASLRSRVERARRACPISAFARVLARIEPTPGVRELIARGARARRPRRRRLRRLPRDPRHDRPRPRRRRLAREPARDVRTAR